MPRPPYPLTLLCSLLPLATLTLWIQSYAFPRHYTYFASVRCFSLSSDAGQASITYMRPSTPGLLKGGDHGGATALIIGNPATAIIYSVEDYPNAKTVRRGWLLVFCYPVLLVLTFAITTVAFLYERPRRQRFLRLQHNLCPSCGYDLRASPSRCPECGTPTPAR